MKNININVYEQKIYLPKGNFIVESSENYLRLNFNFLNQDWINCDLIIAILVASDGKVYKEVLDNNNSVVVKKETLKANYIDISLLGYNSELYQTITTDVLTLPLDDTNKEAYTDLGESSFEKISNSFVKVRTQVINQKLNMIFTRNNGEEFVVPLDDINNDEEVVDLNELKNKVNKLDIRTKVIERPYVYPLEIGDVYPENRKITKYSVLNYNDDLERHIFEQGDTQVIIEYYVGYGFYCEINNFVTQEYKVIEAEELIFDFELTLTHYTGENRLCFIPIENELTTQDVYDELKELKSRFDNLEIAEDNEY